MASDNESISQSQDSILADYLPSVHDNTITAYHVDLSNRSLVIDSKYYDKEITKIEFSGVLAHKFDYVILSNVIYGIYQESISSFIEENKEFLQESVKYGFPLTSVDRINQLGSELEKGSYKCFIIDSSIGLNGFVIAKDIKIDINSL